MKTDDHRPCYRSSGRVDWLRLLLLSPLLFAACAGVAWSLSWVFLRGWYYLVVTPAVAGLLIGVAARLVVGFGRCRNKVVGGIISGVAALLAFVGYYYMHMIAVLGPGTITRLDFLPDFIRFRMATDGLFGRHAHNPNEIMNWLGGGIDLILMTAVAASLTVERASRAYCETCRSWLRRVIVNASPGTARVLHEALGTGGFDQVPAPDLFQVKIGQPMALLELEYCPREAETGSFCPSYLTLKECYKTAGRKPKVDTLTKQWSLADEELRLLAEIFPRLRLAPVSAPPAAAVVMPSESRGTPAAFATRQEVCPGAPYPLDSRWRNTWLILLSLTPLFALAGGLAAMGLAWTDTGGQSEAVRLVLGAFGLCLSLAGGVVTWYNVDWLNHRYLLRFTQSAIGSRPDAWVAADDPQATYVAVVPRKNWGAMLWASDRGFLVADQARGCLLFEGIQERYRIPASSICSCEIETMISGGSIYGVVLRVLRKDGELPQEWEIPFSVAWRGWAKNRGPIRLARAAELKERIEALRDSRSA